MSNTGVRPRLLIIWVVLSALIVVVVLLQYRAAREQESEAVAGSLVDDRSLLPEPIERLGAIEIAYSGALHRFERDASGEWFYHGAHDSAEISHGHKADPVAAARIAKAFEGFGRTRMERRFDFNVQADEYGVVSPQMFIIVFKRNELQPLVRFAVGTIAPDGVSRYVLVVGTPLVVTIANYQIDNLVQLIGAVKAGRH